MVRGKCRLCNLESDLQLSHILPAFAIRWLRESSGTGHVRRSDSPNLRIQDGEKRHWLCLACEGLLNQSETIFAREIFHPYTNRTACRFDYGPWLLSFCVSVSWRVLLFLRYESTAVQTYTPDTLALCDKAESAWRAFLLGQRPNPGPFQQHLLPLEGIAALSNRPDNLAPNLNRYFMRYIDMDILRGENTNYVYAKLGRFVILGFIREDRPDHWKGTKVQVKKGRIEPRTYTVPHGLFGYMNTRANFVEKGLSGISPRQAAKIDKSFRENMDNYRDSDDFIAIGHDIRMFGSAVFTRIGSSEEESDTV